MRGTMMVSGMSRRVALKVGGAWLGMLAPALRRAAAQEDDVLQHWIEGSAIRIEAGSGADWNTHSTERLMKAIGNSRIVMLGEPSHGAGAAFSAKTQLVQLLHERMEFDVLVWESGLIDLERTEAGLRAGVDPVEAAQRGILKIWSASGECRPLFAYASASHRSGRPLTMAGFDMQLPAAGTLDYFAGELRAFVGSAQMAARRGAKELAEEILDSFGRLNRYTDALTTKLNELARSGVNGSAQSDAVQAWNKTEGDSLRPVAEDVHRLEGVVDSLVRLISGHPAGGRSGRAGFMMRAVRSLEGYGQNLLETQGEHTPEEAAQYAVGTENRRDRINAENLRWLIDEEYAGKKIVVWAHNAHVMNAWYPKGFDHVSLTPVADGMKPMGVWLTEWYGPAVYKMGFTTYEGSDGWIGATPTVVPPAPIGSLEERLHRLRVAEAILPLRGAAGWRRSLAPSLAMRIPKYETETIVNPAQPFDAVYFIDKMKPATLN